MKAGPLSRALDIRRDLANTSTSDIFILGTTWVWFWHLIEVGQSHFHFFCVAEELVLFPLPMDANSITAGCLQSGTKLMARRGSGKGKRSRPPPAKGVAKGPSLKSSIPRTQRGSLKQLAKSRDGLLIHALKEAVAKETKLKAPLSFSQMRMTVKGKNSEERRKNRAQVIKEKVSVPRFAGQTPLEMLAVSPRTAVDYHWRVFVFQNFCSLLELRTNTSSQVDHALTVFLNQSFEEGLDISEAQKAFAAVQEAFPVVGRQGLSRSRRSLKGWKKPRSRSKSNTTGLALQSVSLL